MGTSVPRLCCVIGILAVAMGSGAGAEPGPGAAEPDIELAAPPEVAEDLGIVEGPGAPEGEALLDLEEAPPVPDPVPRLQRVWQEADFDTRIDAARRAAVELGAWSFDPAARALAGGGPGAGELERARAAARLAPDLPAAQLGLARAEWLEGDAPMAALRAVIAGLGSLPRHPEAGLWMVGSLLYLLAAALVAGGLLTIFMAALAALPHATHDLGHRVSESLPVFARYAAIAALLCLPLALGEGLLGLAIAATAIGVAYGTRARRMAVTLAAASVVVGSYPVVRAAGDALAAFPSDPVASAAFAVSQGASTPLDLIRLRAAADEDPLAVRALAIHARRSGNLAEADTLYRRLLDHGVADTTTLNNAANVRLDLGHMERALDLYDESTQRNRSPVVLFNLAQAHGRAFHVEDLNRTLTAAQELDGDLVAELTVLQGTDTEASVVDQPLPASLFWWRALHASAGDEVAAEFRARFGPGRLGRDGVVLATVVAVLGLLGLWLAERSDATGWCLRCGDRVCAGCGTRSRDPELCFGCHRLFHEPEKTDRVLRTQRVTELRVREARVQRARTLTSMLVPGAAGLIANRPLCGWLGALCFALLAWCFHWRDGIVPDPLLLGDTAPLVFAAVSLLAALGYCAAVATSLAAGRSR